ncbi:hypothetical protein [Photobacterium leiognathi]|uniref:hypothetical protein n=1 Tax=Photobacterium leiognathi TaxID=553611 RepID=UPI0029821B6E|nr:hypothetical protein [Photobacterium leiognathi]
MQLNSDDLLNIPGRLYFINWLIQNIKSGLITKSEENRNTFILSPQLSDSFVIGRYYNKKIPFIGLSDTYIPWFFDMPWMKLFIEDTTNRHFLVLGENEMELALEIKIRKSRSSILNIENFPYGEKFIDIIGIKKEDDQNLLIGKECLKRLPIEFIKCINDYFINNDKNDNEEHSYIITEGMNDFNPLLASNSWMFDGAVLHKEKNKNL